MPFERWSDLIQTAIPELCGRVLGLTGTMFEMVRKTFRSALLLLPVRSITSPLHTQISTALNAPIGNERHCSGLHAGERVPSQGRGKPAQFNPVRFLFFNKLTEDDRLLVAFDALVLSEVLGREVGCGQWR